MCEHDAFTHTPGSGHGTTRRTLLTGALAAPLVAGVSAGSATAATTVTRWVKPPYTDAYPAMQVKNAVGRLGEAVPVTGYFVNTTWFKITTGKMAGTYVSGSGLTTTNPATQTFAYPSPDPFSLPPVGSRLTRYVISRDFYVSTRASASFSAARRTSIAPRTKVTGKLVSSDWVRLDDGRYITTALLATTPVVRAFNGRVPSGRLRALPAYLRAPSAAASSLERVAAMQFIRMDTAFAKVFGYHITVEEGYRSLYWQKHWYAQYGAPRAAYPGTSNHGMGLAVDIRSGAGSPFTFGTAADKWLTANGAGFGFHRSWWLDQGRPNAEFWHYNFIG